jgi:hypothetical protein
MSKNGRKKILTDAEQNFIWDNILRQYHLMLGSISKRDVINTHAITNEINHFLDKLNRDDLERTLDTEILRPEQKSVRDDLAGWANIIHPNLPKDDSESVIREFVTHGKNKEKPQ